MICHPIQHFPAEDMAPQRCDQSAAGAGRPGETDHFADGAGQLHCPGAVRFS